MKRMFYVPSPVSNGPQEDVESASNLTKTNFIEKYEKEWHDLTSERKLNNLKNYAIQGNLHSSSIRSMYWRVLLGIFPVSSPAQWSLCVKEARRQYDEIKEEFNLDPHVVSCVPDDNPLSQDENSAWSKYFCDKELKKVIKQDVVRTSPEKAFFQSPHIQEIMTNILFYYARKYPEICYRQGMHEILAPILFIVYEDYKVFEMAKQNSVINSFVTEIMDFNYLEADTFHMGKYYEVNNVPTASGHFPLPNFSKENKKSTSNYKESSICVYLNSVRDNMLGRCDRQLCAHLNDLNIPFTTFGIRWLRLLFGREFSFKDLLILWDAIFAVNSNFSLVSFVFVAMMIAVRDKLLNSDYTECLNYLMKYPSSINVKFVINYAMYLQDPKNNKRPNFLLREIPPEGGDIANKSNSKNSNKQMNLTKKLRNLRITSSKKIPKENEFVLVENYSNKSYEVVMTELNRMRVVMSLCKLKLYQYHEILATSISSDDMKAQQALTGIQELCTLLDIDHFSLKPSPKNSSHVENASEAEAQLSYPEASNSFLSHLTSDVVALFLPPPNSEIDMKIFKQCENELTDLSGFPAENPLQLNNKK